MMPCYNAREHLPWALGSMLAQTFADWELVLVDDGSTDHPEDVVEQAADPRIRLIRLPENRGRGHARQVALNNTRGEFLAMLDADDWMYPDRLQIELDVLAGEPTVGIVSAGMALTDARNEITGVRLKGDGVVYGPHRGLRVPIAHGPSMFRRSLASGVCPDVRLKRSEDFDLMLQLLSGSTYIALPDVLYAYQETESISGSKAIESHNSRRKVYQKRLRTLPLEASWAIAQSMAKEAAYRVADALNLNRLVTSGKQELPSRDEVTEFQGARAIVASRVTEVFG